MNSAPSLVERSGYSLFAIVADARTGSNLVVSLLNSHRDICCFAEIFHSAKIYASASDFAIAPEDILKYSLKDRNARPREFLDKIVRTAIASGSIKYYGFKIFLNHSKSALDMIVESDDIAVIFLDRKNKLEQFASLKVALDEKVWLSRSDVRAKAKVRFSFMEFIRFAYRSEKKYLRYSGKLRQAGKEFLRVNYEDIESGRAVDSILCFIGAPKLLVNSNLKKQNNYRSADRFLNPISARLGGMVWRIGRIPLRVYIRFFV